MLRCLCSASSIFLSRLFNKDNDNYQKNGRSWTKTFQDDPLFDVTAKDEQQGRYNIRVIPESFCRESSADIENKESGFPYLT